MEHALSAQAVENIRNRYEERYRMYGYDPRTLDWDKGKQAMRFSVLTSQCDLRGSYILDIGCGFGDLNSVLTSITGGAYRYIGIDVSPSLLTEATTRYGNENVHFKCGDFLSMEVPPVDFVVASGIFNMKLSPGDNYQFIEQTMKKAFTLCRTGLAFNFLSDKVDFCKENTFHSSPERILGLAYSFSRNVALLNNYMPFEFTLFLFKDDSFNPKTTIFNRWLSINGIDIAPNVD